MSIFDEVLDSPTIEYETMLSTGARHLTASACAPLRPPAPLEFAVAAGIVANVKATAGRFRRP